MTRIGSGSEPRTQGVGMLREKDAIAMASGTIATRPRAWTKMSWCVRATYFLTQATDEFDFSSTRCAPKADLICRARLPCLRLQEKCARAENCAQRPIEKIRRRPHQGRCPGIVPPEAKNENGKEKRMVILPLKIFTEGFAASAPRYEVLPAHESHRGELPCFITARLAKAVFDADRDDPPIVCETCKRCK